MSMHREKHMLKSWILTHHKLGVLTGAGKTIASVVKHLTILDRKLSTCHATDLPSSLTNRMQRTGLAAWVGRLDWLDWVAGPVGLGVSRTL